MLAIIRNIITHNACDLYHFLYFLFIWLFLFAFGRIELAPDLIKKCIIIFNEWGYSQKMKWVISCSMETIRFRDWLFSYLSLNFKQNNVSYLFNVGLTLARKILQNEIKILPYAVGDHSFSTYATISVKLIFLIPWYTHLFVRIRGVNVSFSKNCVLTKWMIPNLNMYL